jgi:hypothetical protein
VCLILLHTRLTNQYTFTLGMETTMFVETLDSSQYSTSLSPKAEVLCRLSKLFVAV